MPAEYPSARRLDIVEDILGHQVSDPYRWLEDPASGESPAWLAAQAALWRSYRDSLPGRGPFAARLSQLMHVGRVSLPVWRGQRQFFTRRGPGQEHAVLHVAGAGDARPLIDPMALDPSGRTTLDRWYPSWNGQLVAYLMSSGGDEESSLRVLDVATGDIVDGPIDRCRYARLAWLPDGRSFYYTRQLPKAAIPAAEAQYHRRVYLHRVGASPASDALVFGEGRDKTSFYRLSVSPDGRWLLISGFLGTAPRHDIWIADLSACDPASPSLSVVVNGLDAETHPQVGPDGRLYLLTTYQAARGRLCVTDPASPGLSGWRELVPEDPAAVMRDCALLSNALVVSWTRHAVADVTVHSLPEGARVRSADLPGVGTVTALSQRPEGGDEAWISYTDFATPPVVLRLDTATGTVSTWASPPAAAALPAVQASQATYRSADGTAVRMVILSPGPGSGPRPAILHGYGGLGIPLTPAYSASILAWVEAGGVYAVAGLRGGGEEGEEWHRAGMREHKQHAVDDFLAAGCWLVSSGTTTSSQLAAWGESNGGLVVGAAITQRPSLFSAAVCSAPLLDMVRYERLGPGEMYRAEFGTASDPAELGWLLAYSPYHHVSAGTEYPAVLFTVFTSDTLADPAHACKMCAALQHASASGRPVLLRAEERVGHRARAVRFSVGAAADALAFIARETGLDLRVTHG